MALSHLPLAKRKTLVKIFGDLKKKYKSLEKTSDSHTEGFHLMRRIVEYPLKDSNFNQSLSDNLNCSNLENISRGALGTPFQKKSSKTFRKSVKIKDTGKTLPPLLRNPKDCVAEVCKTVQQTSATQSLGLRSRGGNGQLLNKKRKYRQFFTKIPNHRNLLRLPSLETQASTLTGFISLPFFSFTCDGNPILLPSLWGGMGCGIPLDVFSRKDQEKNCVKRAAFPNNNQLHFSFTNPITVTRTVCGTEKACYTATPVLLRNPLPPEPPSGVMGSSTIEPCTAKGGNRLAELDGTASPVPPKVIMGSQLEESNAAQGIYNNEPSPHTISDLPPLLRNPLPPTITISDGTASPIPPKGVMGSVCEAVQEQVVMLPVQAIIHKIENPYENTRNNLSFPLPPSGCVVVQGSEVVQGYQQICKNSFLTSPHSLEHPAFFVPPLKLRKYTETYACNTPRGCITIFDGTASPVLHSSHSPLRGDREDSKPKGLAVRTASQTEGGKKMVMLIGKSGITSVSANRKIFTYLNHSIYLYWSAGYGQSESHLPALAPSLLRKPHQVSKQYAQQAHYPFFTAPQPKGLPTHYPYSPHYPRRGYRFAKQYRGSRNSSWSAQKQGQKAKESVYRESLIPFLSESDQVTFVADFRGAPNKHTILPYQFALYPQKARLFPLNCSTTSFASPVPPSGVMGSSITTSATQPEGFSAMQPKGLRSSKKVVMGLPSPLSPKIIMEEMLKCSSPFWGIPFFGRDIQSLYKADKPIKPSIFAPFSLPSLEGLGAITNQICRPTIIPITPEGGTELRSSTALRTFWGNRTGPGVLPAAFILPSGAMGSQAYSPFRFAKQYMSNRKSNAESSKSFTQRTDGEIRVFQDCEAGSRDNTFGVFPGQLLTYGDNIANNIVTTESGQVLYVDSEKATLRKAQTVLIYSQAIIAVLSGEWIKKGTPLMSLSYQKLVTGDIVQGLPKIEQFFEAPVLKDGTFWSDSLQAKLNQFFQEQREQLPLAEAVRKGFSEIQRVLVEGVQRVYISQGVLIADKHLEVIVRQMTCKGRILYSGDTGFLRNELVSLDKIENVNQVTYGQKALYHPQVRGITDASLESESFLSAASFQETTRVLSRDAIIGKTDLMRGLKERVIVGELIQAGTGLANNSVYSLL